MPVLTQESVREMRLILDLQSVINGYNAQLTADKKIHKMILSVDLDSGEMEYNINPEQE